MRDLEYDLEVVTEYLNTYLYHDPHQAEYDAKFFRMARDGWIEALRRAIAAEARVKELEYKLRDKTTEVEELKRELASAEHLLHKAEQRAEQVNEEIKKLEQENSALRRECELLGKYANAIKRGEYGTEDFEKWARRYDKAGDSVGKESIERVKLTYEELEAQCAAMRKALQEAISLLKGEKKFPEDLTIWGPGGYNVVRIKNVIEQGEKALSNDAGKTMLERMAKLEAVAEAAKDYMQAIDDVWAGRYDLSTVPAGEMLPEEIRLRKALAELEGDKNA